MRDNVNALILLKSEAVLLIVATSEAENISTLENIKNRKDFLNSTKCSKLLLYKCQKI